MAVNTLMTGLIVFKILKVFLEVSSLRLAPERTLSITQATRGTKLRHIIFVIIESGMALFAIQLVRVVLANLRVQSAPSTIDLVIAPHLLDFVIVINQMFNVIIRSIYFYFCFY